MFTISPNATIFRLEVPARAKQDCVFAPPKKPSALALLKCLSLVASEKYGAVGRSRHRRCNPGRVHRLLHPRLPARPPAVYAARLLHLFCESASRIIRQQSAFPSAVQYLAHEQMIDNPKFVIRLMR